MVSQCLLQWVDAAAADAALDGAKEEDLSWTMLTVEGISGLNHFKQKCLAFSIRCALHCNAARHVPSCSRQLANHVFDLRGDTENPAELPLWNNTISQ
jgi:hypothetical protein